MHQLPGAGPGPRVDDRGDSADTHPFQLPGVAGGLETPCQVQHRIGAVEHRRQFVGRPRRGQVDAMPPGDVVRRFRRRLTAITSAVSGRVRNSRSTAVPTLPLAPTMTMRMVVLFPFMGSLTSGFGEKSSVICPFLRL